MGSPHAELVAPVARSHGQRVGEDQGPRGRREGRLQHQGPVDIAPGARPLTDRLHLPVTGLVAEQPAEHRGTVEPREGQPVDRPGPGHQGARVAVGEKCVVRDGCAGHARRSDRVVVVSVQSRGGSRRYVTGDRPGDTPLHATRHNCQPLRHRCRRRRWSCPSWPGWAGLRSSPGNPGWPGRWWAARARPASPSSWPHSCSAPAGCSPGWVVARGRRPLVQLVPVLAAFLLTVAPAFRQVTVDEAFPTAVDVSQPPRGIEPRSVASQARRRCSAAGISAASTIAHRATSSCWCAARRVTRRAPGTARRGARAGLPGPPRARRGPTRARRRRTPGPAARQPGQPKLRGTGRPSRRDAGDGAHLVSRVRGARGQRHDPVTTRDIRPQGSPGDTCAR